MSTGGQEIRLPGWYPHPTDGERECFWDGDEWTQKTRPRPLLRQPPPARPAPSRPRREREWPSGIDWTGYVFAVVLPIVGFILGLTQINRSRHGLNVVVLSVVMILIYAWRLSH